MTAPEILWWVRLVGDVHFGFIVLGAICSEFLYLTATPPTQVRSQTRAMLTALWVGWWLAVYPFGIRPVLDAGMGG